HPRGARSSSRSELRPSLFPFFFQAEDGIRHLYVTGVQTCALPISANAEKVVDDTDRRRDQYVRTYYGRHRPDVVNYDVVVNTERLGIEGAAALVVAEARRRRWQ